MKKTISAAVLATQAGLAAAQTTTCETAGNMTYCRGDDGSTVTIERAGNASYIRTTPGRNGSSPHVYEVREGSAICVYEQLSQYARKKLGCRPAE
jgi:hypothetical protein